MNSSNTNGALPDCNPTLLSDELLSAWINTCRLQMEAAAALMEGPAYFAMAGARDRWHALHTAALRERGTRPHLEKHQ